MTPPKDTDRAPTAEETRRRVRKAQRAALKAYETANDLVPGTAGIRDAKGPTDIGTPSGGQEWAGLARMAAARRPEDRTALDLDALERHPSPPSGLTGPPA